MCRGRELRAAIQWGCSRGGWSCRAIVVGAAELKLMTGEDQRPSRMAKSVDPDTPRPPKLYRWGVLVAHHRRAVLIVSVLVLACSAALLPVLQRALGAPGYQVKGSESARVEQLLERHFPNLGTETDALVLNSRSYIASDGVYRRTIRSVLSTMRRQRCSERAGPV